MSQSARAAASSATSACSLNKRPVEVLALTTRGASPRSCALKRAVSCCHSVVAAFSLAKAPSCTPKPGSERQALEIAGEGWAEPAGGGGALGQGRWPARPGDGYDCTAGLGLSRVGETGAACAGVGPARERAEPLPSSLTRRESLGAAAAWPVQAEPTAGACVAPGRRCLPQSR